MWQEKFNKRVSRNKWDEKQTSWKGEDWGINQEETSSPLSQDKAPCLLDHWHFKPHPSTATGYTFLSNSVIESKTYNLPSESTVYHFY